MQLRLAQRRLARSKRSFLPNRTSRRASLPASCSGDPFGDLRNSRAAAAGRVLYQSPGMLGLQHLCDANVALLVFRPALVDASRLRLGLTFCLPAPTILVILASDSGEHIEQHAVNRIEHARVELTAVAGCHDP